ncbi:MAG: hypothetical protein ACYDHM_13505 [Acidiferrobacterales bacterium]
MNPEMQLSMSHRSVLLRVLFGALWFIPIFFGGDIVVGAIVGAIAGGHTTTYAAGHVAGQVAAAEFFQSYGRAVLGVEILLTVALSLLGLLPGTAKFRKR